MRVGDLEAIIRNLEFILSAAESCTNQACIDDMELDEDA